MVRPCPARVSALVIVIQRPPSGSCVEESFPICALFRVIMPHHFWAQMGQHPEKSTFNPEKGTFNPEKSTIGITQKVQKNPCKSNSCSDSLARARAIKTRTNKKKACVRPRGPRGLPPFLPVFPCDVGSPRRSPRRITRPPEGADCPPRHPARRLGRLLGVGHAAPRPPGGCAPLRALNGHAGTPANAQQRQRRGKADSDTQAR